MIADTENDRLVYNSSYYCIAHFSRYIQPGAVCIFCSGAEPLLCTAFLNPDGCIAAILQNGTDSAVRCAVKLEGLEYPLVLDAHSISTVIWSRG